MRFKEFTKSEFKAVLTEAVYGCNIQYDGWTCGTCFFDLSYTLDNKDWQSLLLYRGDTKKEELHNLPKSPRKSILKIWKIINSKDNLK